MRAGAPLTTEHGTLGAPIVLIIALAGRKRVLAAAHHPHHPAAHRRVAILIARQRDQHRLHQGPAIAPARGAAMAAVQEDPLFDPLCINCWSGPRCCSTSLMYSFAQRDDTCVLDEPLYASYLKLTGVQRPYLDQVRLVAPCAS
jgi:hypothetical protein